MLEFRFHLHNPLFIFLRFLLQTLSMFFCWEKREKQLLLFESLKYLTQQTKTYSKLATVTLKQDVKFVNTVETGFLY